MPTTPREAAKTATQSPRKPGARKAVRFEVAKAVRSHGYRVMRRTPPDVLVATIRAGVPARFLKQMAGDMAVPQERIYETLGLARATLVRKAKEGKFMSPSETERALGLAKLIGQAEEIVARSGDPTDFNAARWIAEWLQQPNPALDGTPPADWMDTTVGRDLVFDTLARMESGAYA